MPQRNFDENEHQYEERVMRALANTLTDGGLDAQYWHSGGGIMTVMFEVGGGWQVVVGLANAPQWGFDINDADGEFIDGGSIDANIGDPSWLVAYRLSQALYNAQRIDITE